MKKNLFFTVVVLLSVAMFSACSGEESVLMASIPEAPAEKPEVPEEDEEFINWEFSFSTIVEKKTTLSEDGVVDFHLVINDKYEAEYMGQTHYKDSVRTYDFSNVMPAEWRNISLAMSKGYKLYQKEFTNHTKQLKRNSYETSNDSTVVEGGWTITRTSGEFHFNIISETNPEDAFDPTGSCNSFSGFFTDEHLGEIQMDPVNITMKFNGFSIKHHKDSTYRYDEESGRWIDRPWENGENVQSGVSAKENGKEYLRYPIICTVKFSCPEFNVDKKMYSEYDYWVEYNEEEWILEGNAVLR